jgi:uncharacterized protein YdhG (YjbR/CyaY superfamily)
MVTDRRAVADVGFPPFSLRSGLRQYLSTSPCAQVRTQPSLRATSCETPDALTEPSGRIGPRHAAPPTCQQNEAVSADEIDQYISNLLEPKRTTLATLRQTIADILPDADQGMSYGAPAFKVQGQTVAGFAAFKNHLSYLPHSGSVFPQLADELQGYSTSLGALRFDVGQPLPAPLVAKLIAVRLREAFPG